MSKEELEENLGTIAKSGSLAFKEEMKKKKKTTMKMSISLVNLVWILFCIYGRKRCSCYYEKAGSDEAL